jgi:hypothetical protein
MPAVSKKQQRFFGIVRAIQKGEMAPTTPETAKAAADMKKSDVKDFASTKHKKLPEKKVAKESRYEKYDTEKKKFAKADKRMKFGKFYDKAKEARDRLRPGEVKRYDKTLGRYVSNKE